METEIFNSECTQNLLPSNPTSTPSRFLPDLTSESSNDRPSGVGWGALKVQCLWRAALDSTCFLMVPEPD